MEQEVPEAQGMILPVAGAQEGMKLILQIPGVQVLIQEHQEINLLV
ncbi:hypothetical protein [Chryseobacterium camelliae]|nr:hypothetical protein [Chryseobacterium camelliae]